MMKVGYYNSVIESTLGLTLVSIYIILLLSISHVGGENQCGENRLKLQKLKKVDMTDLFKLLNLFFIGK